MKFIDFWQDYVLFAGPLFGGWVLDIVGDTLGDYAGFIAYVIVAPITLALMFFGVIATGALIVVVIAASPIILPVTIYLHMRTRT